MVKKIAFTVLIVTFVSCTTTDSDLITKNSSKSHVLLDLDYNAYHHKNKNI